MGDSPDLLRNVLCLRKVVRGDFGWRNSSFVLIVLCDCEITMALTESTLSSIEDILAGVRGGAPGLLNYGDAFGARLYSLQLYLVFERYLA